MNVRILMLCLAVLLSGCSAMGPGAGVSEQRSKLIAQSEEVLKQLVFAADYDAIYDNSAETFQQTTWRGQFKYRLEQVFATIPQQEVVITGYEPEDEFGAAVVYAESSSSFKPLFYKLVFVEQKKSGLKLVNLGLQESELEKSDNYSLINPPIVIRPGGRPSAEQSSIEPQAI